MEWGVSVCVFPFVWKHMALCVFHTRAVTRCDTRGNTGRYTGPKNKAMHQWQASHSWKTFCFLHATWFLQREHNGTCPMVHAGNRRQFFAVFFSQFFAVSRLLLGNARVWFFVQFLAFFAVRAIKHISLSALLFLSLSLTSRPATPSEWRLFLSLLCLHGSFWIWPGWPIWHWGFSYFWNQNHCTSWSNSQGIQSA